MTKLLIITICLFFSVTNSCKAAIDPGDGPMHVCETNPCIYGTLSSACITTCKNCNFSSFTLNGITTTTYKRMSYNCPTYDTTNTFACNCDVTSTSYKCASGYYGTATSGKSGCTICPTNATCTGGNSSTFVCSAGYYKNGTKCTSCASATNATSATSAAGTTAITGCYIPANTTSSSTAGNFKYTSNCYYSN